MKLHAFCRNDPVLLQDMISLGLIEETWPNRYPNVLANRLKELLDNPDG